jgi:hypothetical protein
MQSYDFREQTTLKNGFDMHGGHMSCAHGPTLLLHNYLKSLER